LRSKKELTKGTIALAVALIALLGLLGYFYTQMKSLQFQVTSLTTQISNLTQQINDLQTRLGEKDRQIQEYETSIGQLQTQVSNYEALNTRLEGQVERLEADYRYLQSDYEALQRSYGTLEGRYYELQRDYSELETEYEMVLELLKLYEEVPNGYYSAGAFSHHSNTYDALCSFLTREFELPRDYKRGIFDCSESAAYLEWALENAGFNVYIAVGPTPWDPNSGRHAWVIAYTTEYKVAIEATALTGEYSLSYLFTGRTPGVVYWEDSLIPGWENYYEGYDGLYKNIYDAVREYRSVAEWNWWMGYWGFI